MKIKDFNWIIELFIIIIVVILIFQFCMVYYTSNNFRIEKIENGYEIYKDGELIWEFTKQNTDSLSLETLRMIYEGY